MVHDIVVVAHDVCLGAVSTSTLTTKLGGALEEHVEEEVRQVHEVATVVLRPDVGSDPN